MSDERCRRCNGWVAPDLDEHCEQCVNDLMSTAEEDFAPVSTEECVEKAKRFVEAASANRSDLDPVTYRCPDCKDSGHRTRFIAGPNGAEIYQAERCECRGTSCPKCHRFVLASGEGDEWECACGWQWPELDPRAPKKAANPWT